MYYSTSWTQWGPHLWDCSLTQNAPLLDYWTRPKASSWSPVCNVLPQVPTTATEPGRPWLSLGHRGDFLFRECEEMKRKWVVVSLAGRTSGTHVFYYEVWESAKVVFRKRRKECIGGGAEVRSRMKSCLGSCRCPARGCASWAGPQWSGSSALWVGHPSTPQRTLVPETWATWRERHDVARSPGPPAPQVNHFCCGCTLAPTTSGWNIKKKNTRAAKPNEEPRRLLHGCTLGIPSYRAARNQSDLPYLKLSELSN